MAVFPLLHKNNLHFSAIQLVHNVGMGISVHTVLQWAERGGGGAGCYSLQWFERSITGGRPCKGSLRKNKNKKEENLRPVCLSCSLPLLYFCISVICQHSERAKQILHSLSTFSRMSQWQIELLQGRYRHLPAIFNQSSCRTCFSCFTDSSHPSTPRCAMVDGGTSRVNRVTLKRAWTTCS